MTDRTERVLGGAGDGSAGLEREAGGSSPVVPRLLAPGLVVLDLRVERVGVVQEAGCETVWLRPRSGGREWEARAEDLRVAGT
ncbi:hypothetical protein MTQ01_00305 [Streptomyces sp. XM4193]|uniref:hypothetical protein n=1 Tax=Streptomyces sp. XM4193 TaxID=2929782 RepID=UPI001FFB7E56|nr:hypothetical protein [Streptomyces sp. XM4193]MCK1794493.1 hypothetical protein [Streptomyces sp. XM4193]